jgi:ArsR family transcriptional regulator
MPTATNSRKGGRTRAADPRQWVTDDTITDLCDLFKMLADASRLKILLALAQDGELHVSALCELLDQSQPAVSHHLTLMRMTGLVGSRRDGKHNFYRLKSAQVRELLTRFFPDGNGHRPALAGASG